MGIIETTERKNTGNLEREITELDKKLSAFIDLAKKVHTRAALIEDWTQHYEWLVEVASEELYVLAGLEEKGGA